MSWGVGNYSVVMYQFHPDLKLSRIRGFLRLALVSNGELADAPAIYARTRGEGIVISNLILSIFAARRNRYILTWSKWAGRLNKVPDGSERNQELTALRQEARKCKERI